MKPVGTAKEIRIVLAAPSTKAVIKIIPNTLEAMRLEVGAASDGASRGREANLELYKHEELWRQAIHCYIDEDGSDPSLKLKANISLGPGRAGFILGNVIASKADVLGKNATGEEVGLTEHEAEFTRRFLDTLRGLS